MAVEGERDAVGLGERNLNAKARRTGRLAKGEEEGRGWQGRVQRVVFVVGGVGALALGGELVRAEWFKGPALPPFAVAVVPQRMFDAYQHKDYAAGTALARRTLRDAPLSASVYYYLGLFLAVSDEEGVDQQVDDQFQAERVLDPVMPDVPAHEALAWAGYDPARQTALEMEELARMGRIDVALGRYSKEGLPSFRDLVSRGSREPDVQWDLLAMVRPDRRFEAWWTQMTSPLVRQTRVDQLAADEAWLKAGGVVRPDWYLSPENAGPSLPAVPGDGGGAAG